MTDTPEQINTATQPAAETPAEPTARTRRSRARKTQPEAPDVFDQAIADRQAQEAAVLVQEVADATRMPENGHAPEQPATNGHAAKLRKTQEHSKITIPAGDTLVHFIDKGSNEAGIGIRIAFPEGAKGRPTDEEKDIIRRIVKGEDGQESGFAWNRDFGMWHKAVARNGERNEDVPSNRAVAIRLDAESRVHKLADALKRHQADPAGYREMIRQEREQVAQGQALPD